MGSNSGNMTQCTAKDVHFLIKPILEEAQKQLPQVVQARLNITECRVIWTENFNNYFPDDRSGN